MNNDLPKISVTNCHNIYWQQLCETCCYSNLILGLIQVPEEVSVITKDTAGARICSCSLGREWPETAQAEFLNYCLTCSGHLRLLVIQLDLLIISMCWKCFLFSVPSTEGKNFSLLPLENGPTKKQEPICKTQAEVSQPYHSFVSLFLTHSQNYHLILFYWIFNSRQKCLGFSFVLFSFVFPQISSNFP